MTDAERPPERLVARFQHVRLELPAGVARVPAEPLRAEEVVALAGGQVEQVVDPVAWLEGAWATEPLFAFQWLVNSPVGSWSATLSLLHADASGAYMVAENDIEDESVGGWRLFARLEPGPEPDLLGALLVDLLGSGGDAYGIVLGPRPPDEVNTFEAAQHVRPTSLGRAFDAWERLAVRQSVAEPDPDQLHLLDADTDA